MFKPMTFKFSCSYRCCGLLWATG